MSLADPHQCGYTIEGPKVKGTRSAVTWRKHCKRTVRDGFRYCWQHRPASEIPTKVPKTRLDNVSDSC